MTASLSRAQAWMLAIRPKTLPAAVGPVFVGTAAAVRTGGFHFASAMACLLTTLCLQVAVNLANDYFDAKDGHDTKDRIGPIRVTGSGLIPGWQVLSAMLLFMGLSVLFGSLLMIRGGIPAVLLGLFCLLGVLAYSGGPYPLAPNGLGDPAAFFFFGPVAVCGTSWIQSGSLSGTALLASIPVGLLVSAIMVVNNTRDIETDARTGKRTLETRIGPIRSRYLYTGLLAGAHLVPAGFLAQGAPFMLLPLLSLPLAILCIQDIWHMDGALLNGLLAKTARFGLFFSVLFGVALMVG